MKTQSFIPFSREYFVDLISTKLKKLKVCIDCDDVIFWCNKLACLKSGVDYYTLLGWMSDSPNVEFFNSPEFVANQTLIPGAKELVEHLLADEAIELIFLTAVPPQCMAARAEAIKRFFPSVKDSQIIITSRKDLVQCDILLDDGPHNIQKTCAKLPVVFKRPWNHELTGYLGVSSYDEFKFLIERVKQLSGISSESFEDDGSNTEILCLVGPSGSGKTEIAKELEKYNIKYVKSTTTANNSSISKSDFFKQFDAGEFIEYSSYAGELYALKEEDINKNEVSVIPIDISGANALKCRYGNKVRIFYIQTAVEDCIKNIIASNLSIEEKTHRIISLKQETAYALPFCDSVVYNNDTKMAVAQILHEISK